MKLFFIQENVDGEECVLMLLTGNWCAFKNMFHKAPSIKITHGFETYSFVYFILYTNTILKFVNPFTSLWCLACFCEPGGGKLLSNQIIVWQNEDGVRTRRQHSILNPIHAIGEHSFQGCYSPWLLSWW